MKKLKQVAIGWAHKKKIFDEQELKSVNEFFQAIYDTEGGGYMSNESKELLLQLESKLRKLLKDQEANWRLKSRALWLKFGDENTKFFQLYAKGRQLKNTIWSLSDSLHSKVWLIWVRNILRPYSRHRKGLQL